MDFPFICCIFNLKINQYHCVVLVVGDSTSVDWSTCCAIYPVYFIDNLFGCLRQMDANTIILDWAVIEDIAQVIEISDNNNVFNEFSK